MLTADTLTDEKIRELIDASGSSPTTINTCFEALGPSDMFWSWQQPTPDRVRDCRARCAEIINARAKAGQP